MLLPPIQWFKGHIFLLFFSECQPFNDVGILVLSPFHATLTALLTVLLALWLSVPFIIKGRNSLLLLNYKFPLCSFASWNFFLVEPSVHLTLLIYFISHLCCILGEFPHDLACYNEWNGNDFSKNTIIKKLVS